MNENDQSYINSNPKEFKPEQERIDKRDENRT